MISDKLIQELQGILKRKYNMDLTFEETAKIGNQLVAFFKVLAKIDYKEKKGLNKNEDML